MPQLPPTAFVAMPFAPEMRRNYDRVIRPALERAGVAVIRADEEPGGHIHDQMIERLADADLVVADISGTNPNVLYELGVAHALRERSIMVVREDFARSIPFDVMPYRVFVFPDPDTAAPAAIEASISHLETEIRRVAHDLAVAVPNPVQAFLGSRSPLKSVRSLNLANLPSAEFDHAADRAVERLSYVGISASSCAKPVIEAIESGTRTRPLHLELGVLSPECIDGWRFLHCLRDGRPGTPEEIDDFRAENRSFQEGWTRKLGRVAERHRHFTFRVTHLMVPIHFWALMLDTDRLFVGPFALYKETATGMPVAALVDGDPATRPQFLYYRAAIQALLAGSRPSSVNAGHGPAATSPWDNAPGA